MWSSDEPGYFHICTDGNAVPWIFQNDEDFIAGVNRIGICAIISKTETVAYTLMDNHGHFLMYGTLLACKQFINTYKVLTGKHISRKYKINNPLRDLPVEIIPIKNEEELMTTIAYLDRNSVMQLVAIPYLEGMSLSLVSFLYYLLTSWPESSYISWES